jgi:Tfp pilus assembly protein PilZ
MKKRPVTVVLFAAACAIYPLLLVLQILNLGPGGVGDALKTFVWSSGPLVFAGENLVVTALAWFAAYAVYHTKAWSWWLAVVAALGLVAFSVGVSLYRAQDVGDAWLWTSVVIIAVPMVVAALLLQREIRTPYFNPRVRWWESEPRYAIDASVRGGGRALDISRHGMFIQHDSPPEVGKEGEWLFEIDGHEVRVAGEVSWLSPGEAEHPAGFGVRFAPQDEATGRVIDEIIEERRRLGDKQWGERAVRYPSDIRCAGGELVLDISTGGMFVQTRAIGELGETVNHRLIYGNHEIPVTGRVVWISRGRGFYPPGHGVKFIIKDADTRSMLHLLIDELWKANLTPVTRQH